MSMRPARPTSIAALVLTLLAPPVLAQDDCVRIDDFATAKIGDFPADWKVRKGAGKAIYRVADEGGRRFVHASSQNQGIQAAKAFEWDLQKYPVLAWSWRPVEFPRGANEKSGK